MGTEKICKQGDIHEYLLDTETLKPFHYPIWIRTFSALLVMAISMSFFILPRYVRTARAFSSNQVELHTSYANPGSISTGRDR